MLKTIEEVQEVQGGVINGVDNANLLSVDSTTPFQTEADELNAEETATEEETEEQKAAKKEEAEKKEKEEKEKSGEELSEEDAAKKAAEEAEAEAEAANAVKTPAKDSAEKRIGKLTKKWRTAERDRDYEKTKRLAAEAELKKLKLTVPATDKPDPEDYEDTSDYLEALTDWKVEQKLNARQAEVTTETEEITERQTADEVEDELETIADKGRDKYDNYDDLVFDKDLVITQEMIETILQSDIAEEILYHLGQNPETATELGEMSALRAAREIGKLEMEIAANMPKPNVSSKGEGNSPDKTVVPPVKKKTTKAPAPIIPVKATGVSEKDPLKMNAKEYRAWRESNKE